jgi:phage repressor protein C with HTH and peptisase S24 domain
MSFTHKQLWRAIDRLAFESNITVSALAVRAGLDPTAFNQSKRHHKGQEHWPTTKTLAKILEVTDESLENFSQMLK